MALLETRMEDHSILRDSFNFDGMLEVPAQCQAGGIVFLWIGNMVVVTRICQSNQELHVMIQAAPNRQPWLFSIIYASTRFINRI